MVHHKIPRKKLRGIFYCYFPEKQELGAPSGARRVRVFQAVKKTLVGANIARPCPFVKDGAAKKYKTCCYKKSNPPMPFVYYACKRQILKGIGGLL